MNMCILHAPLYAGATAAELRAAARGALSTRAANTSVGFTEAYPIVDELRERPAWRMTMGTGASDRRRGPRDNPIMTRAGLPCLGQLALQACRAAEPAKWAPERWLHASLFTRHGRRVAHVTLHAHAVVQNKAGGPLMAAGARLGEFRRSMHALEDLLAILRLQKYQIVFTGDVNYRRTPGDDWHWAPHAVLRRAGMDYEPAGVDVLAWSKTLPPVEVVESRRAGMDHPWLRGEFAL